MLRVAIVDDHAIVRAGLREMLTDEVGISVAFETASGEEALATLQDTACDVHVSAHRDHRARRRRRTLACRPGCGNDLGSRWRRRGSIVKKWTGSLLRIRRWGVRCMKEKIMAIAITLKNYLQRHHTDFEVTMHSRTGCSMETAATAHVPGDRLAKSVLLKDELGYVMAVLPSTCHVAVGALNRRMGRHFRLAEERELAMLFRDCEPGAVPAIGPAYDLKTVIDERITTARDVYFEAGDHEELIHMSMDQFITLMDGTEWAQFSRHMQTERGFAPAHC